MEKKLLEVEGDEMAIFSSKGVMAIIPKNKVNWVKKKLNEGCHECIDALVESLPNFDQQGQKAADGVMLETDPPVTGTPPANLPWINGQGQYAKPTSMQVPSKANSALRPMTNEEKAVYDNEQWRLPDSTLENIMELVDPTGTFSHDDAKRAYEVWKASGRVTPTLQEGLDMFSAVPGLGKYGKYAYLSQGSNLAKPVMKSIPWQQIVNLFGTEELYGPVNKGENSSEKNKIKK